MRTLLAFIDGTARIGAYAAAIMIFAIASLIVAEVICRALLNISLSFAWEFSAYCMAGAVFCGAAYTLRTGGHVQVRLLSSAVSPRFQHWMEVLATAVGVVAAGFLAHALVTFAWLSFQRGAVSPTIVRPLW